MSKTMRWGMYILTFGYVLFLCWLFLIVSSDEVKYSASGNIFVLQWKEYLVWHGRFLTHGLLRGTLQLGEPWVYICKALIISLLYWVSINTIIKKDLGQHKILALAIFIFLNALLPFTMFLMYFIINLPYLYSNYITVIFFLLFLKIYVQIFEGKTPSNIPLFCFFSFLTGSTHEQAISLVPMVILIFLILKLRKLDVPRWYWLPVPFFLIGYSIILLSPGNKIRGLVYAGAEHWEFMGQTLNWMTMGWEKYFYALYRHLFLSSTPLWYQYPGYLPSSWHIQLLIILFTFLNWRKYRSFWDNHVLFPLLYTALSWSTCIVMAASPMYHSATVEFSKFFLYVALMQAIYYCIKDIKPRILSVISCLLLTVVITGQLIQVPGILKARKDYVELEKAIGRGDITEAKLPEARLGNILIIKFGDGLPLKYPHFKIIE